MWNDPQKTDLISNSTSTQILEHIKQLLSDKGNTGKRSSIVSATMAYSAIAIALLAGGINIVLTFCALWGLPAGTEIRPLDLVGYEIVVSVIAFAIDVCVLIILLVVRRRRFALIVLLTAVILAPASFFLGGWTEEWIVRVHHLVEKP